jgi:hypothetical protein
MKKTDIPKADLYSYIKDNAYHRLTDKNHTVVLLRKKFSNTIEEIYFVLEEAILSEDISKIQELDAKYNYEGTLSNIHKAVKPK